MSVDYLYDTLIPSVVNIRYGASGSMYADNRPPAPADPDFDGYPVKHSEGCPYCGAPPQEARP